MELLLDSAAGGTVAGLGSPCCFWLLWHSIGSPWNWSVLVWSYWRLISTAWTHRLRNVKWKNPFQCRTDPIWIHYSADKLRIRSAELLSNVMPTVVSSENIPTRNLLTIQHHVPFSPISRTYLLLWLISAAIRRPAPEWWWPSDLWRRFMLLCFEDKFQRVRPTWSFTKLSWLTVGCYQALSASCNLPCEWIISLHVITDAAGIMGAM